MAWRLASSLETLRAQVNEFAPQRSKASDGTIGNPEHASRPSRHNPNKFSVVTALDLTHDPVGGFDAHAWARRHVLDPHPELAYIISRGEVARRVDGFVWRKYLGANPHDKHIHNGVGIGPDGNPLPPYDSLVLWSGFNLEDDMTPEEHDLLVQTHLLATAAANDAAAALARVNEVYDKIDPTDTVRADIRLTRSIADTVGAPAPPAPPPAN